MSIEHTQETYRNEISDFSNPLFVKIHSLHRDCPNDADFGNRVRKMISEIENFQREKAIRMSDQQLKEILKK
jgi:hypothetical protein